MLVVLLLRRRKEVENMVVSMAGPQSAGASGLGLWLALRPLESSGRSCSLGLLQHPQDVELPHGFPERCLGALSQWERKEMLCSWSLGLRCSQAKAEHPFVLLARRWFLAVSAETTCAHDGTEVPTHVHMGDCSHGQT